MPVPSNIQGGFQNHMDKHEVGGFLTSVLENDLAMAWARADLQSKANFGDIVDFMRFELDPMSWGSREKVKAWIASGRAQEAHTHPEGTAAHTHPKEGAAVYEGINPNIAWQRVKTLQVKDLQDGIDHQDECWTIDSGIHHSCDRRAPQEDRFPVLYCPALCGNLRVEGHPCNRCGEEKEPEDTPQARCANCTGRGWVWIEDPREESPCPICKPEALVYLVDTGQVFGIPEEVAEELGRLQLMGLALRPIELADLQTILYREISLEGPDRVTFPGVLEGLLEKVKGLIKEVHERNQDASNS